MSLKMPTLMYLYVYSFKKYDLSIDYVNINLSLIQKLTEEW